MKKLFTLLLALVLGLGLFACDGAGEASGTLKWNIGAEPLTIDPTLNGASDGGDVINQTFEGLVREVEGIINPGIAEEWEVSEDGLTVTFHLRESKWSDGSDLTAHDFEYAFKRGMDPATASEYSWIWEYTNIVGSYEAVFEDGSLDDVGVEATDDTTLVITLKQPTLYFVSLMGFYHFMPVKQSAVEAVGGEDGLWAADPNLVVSNGPFVLTAYEAGEGLTLTKNENYWNSDEVYLESIDAKFNDDAQSAYNGYQTGLFDVIPDIPRELVPTLMAEDSEFYVFPLLGTYYYNFNLDLPVYQNVKLRKAFAYAIDREAICDALGAGELPAAGFVPPGFLDNNGDDFFEVSGTYGVASDDSNFDEAVALFAEAAEEMDMTVEELQAYLSGREFSYNTSLAHAAVAQLVAESWYEVLGVDMELYNMDWSDFQDYRRDGLYEISRGGWLTDFMDPAGLLAIFTTGNSYNDPNYSNPAFDTLMSEAQAATSPSIHFSKLYQAQAILISDMPIVPVYHYSDIMMVKDHVEGWSRSVLGSIDFTHAKLTNQD
ncbi:MAG: peptide ABC transporter substrate-binding protein [Bacilli bacterium]|nr:peptide ABC transporter substrate-binding protein [Bacilli bacterium]MBN2696238.1 peptide ABC transporter substrate-binding protein [Bacilli bacterium]